MEEKQNSANINQTPRENVAPASPAAPSVYPQAAKGIGQEPGPVLSASQMGMGRSKSGFNLRKFVIVAVVMLAAAGGAFGALVFTNILPLTKFKTVVYDNGKGDKYSVKFYSRHSAKNAPGASSGLKLLASKVSADGKAPLTMWAETNEGTKEAFKSNDCTKNSLPKAFDARVDYINANVVVCVSQDQGVDLVYLATFHDAKHGYMVFFSQDVDFTKMLSNPKSAQEGVATFGLTGYQEDIKTILASVKPLN